MEEPARYQHDCARCTYLGRHGTDDLYACTGSHSLIARGSDERDYLSAPSSNMWIAAELREAYRRACDRGIIRASGRDRVYMAVFEALAEKPRGPGAPIPSDVNGRLIDAFAPHHWDIAELMLDTGGGELLYRVAFAGSRELAGRAVAKALAHGARTLEELRAVLNDPIGYISAHDDRPYTHETGCSAKGNPRWDVVDACGVCDMIRYRNSEVDPESQWVPSAAKPPVKSRAVSRNAAAEQHGITGVPL